MVKDNSANTGEAHLTLVDHEREDATPWSQRVPVLNTLADCERATTTYSKEEVDQAVGYYRQLESLLPKLEWKPTEPGQSGLVIKSRFFRAIYSAQVARASAEIGADREVLSHRIAERGAVMLETEGPAEISKRADAQLRRTIQKIFADPVLLELFTTKKSGDIETYFLNLLFPPTPPPASAGGTTSAA